MILGSFKYFLSNLHPKQMNNIKTIFPRNSFLQKIFAKLFFNGERELDMRHHMFSIVVVVVFFWRENSEKTDEPPRVIASKCK